MGSKRRAVFRDAAILMEFLQKVWPGGLERSHSVRRETMGSIRMALRNGTPTEATTARNTTSQPSTVVISYYIPGSQSAPKDSLEAISPGLRVRPAESPYLDFGSETGIFCMTASMDVAGAP